MGFATLWPGFGVGGALKRDLSNTASHPDSSKHSKFLRGDGQWVSVSEEGSGVEWVDVPASSTAPGTAGQVAYDSDYFYVCIDTDTWRRFALNDWES